MQLPQFGHSCLPQLFKSGKSADAGDIVKIRLAHVTI